MNKGFEEILKALEMIEAPVQEPLEYRLHYNDEGKIYLCSMQQHPENTQYIVVSKEEYDHYYLYCVYKGKLKKIDNNIGLHVKLKLGDSGYATVKNHASILLEPFEDTEKEFWSSDV